MLLLLAEPGRAVPLSNILHVSSFFFCLFSIFAQGLIVLFLALVGRGAWRDDHHQNCVGSLWQRSVQLGPMSLNLSEHITQTFSL